MLLTMKALFFTLLIVCSVAASSQSEKAPESASSTQARNNNPGYDSLVGSGQGTVLHAEVPFYPLLAIQGRLSGAVHLHVLVENGAVIDAESDSPAQLRILVITATENVRTWRFAPGARGKFDVTFTYELEQPEEVRPENPHGFHPASSSRPR